MPKFRRRRKGLRTRRTHGPGEAPGKVKAPLEAEKTRIQLIAYDGQRMVEKQNPDADDITNARNEYRVVWVNVDGLSDAKVIVELGKLFRLHELALEDVVNTHQRSKLEPYDEHLFVIAHMASMAGTAESQQIETEQVSMFLGEKFVVTFQERQGDCFDPVRKRLRKRRGRIRNQQADYLLYALLDSILDAYFPLLDVFADRLENMEDRIVSGDGQHTRLEVHDMRSDMLMLRRVLHPLREAIKELMREESGLLRTETVVYLRDCYDHSAQLIDLLETYREMCSDMRDYYLSMISHRMNEVMKLLTIISTIFIPLSFIAGLYGMNFDTAHSLNMPELSWAYGYPVVVGIMGLIGFGLMVFFWRKGWLTNNDE